MHLDVEDFQAIGQGVVEPGGRDGDQQARYDRKESFADVLESHQNDGPLRSTHVAKSAIDTHHCAEEPDEGSGCRDGGEVGEASLYLEAGCGGRQLPSAVDEFENLGFRER